MKTTVGRRIALGFGLAILALIVLSLVSVIAVVKIHAGMSDNIKAREYRREFDNALKAHVIWSEAVGRSIIDRTKNKLDLVLDPRQCDFGKWYYSDARKEVEEFAPQLIALLSQLAAPHERLHEVGREISKLLESGERDAAALLYLRTLLPQREQIGSNFNDLHGEVTKNVLSDTAVANMVDQYRVTIGTIGVVSCAAIISLAFLLSRNIKTMLNETINALSTTSTEIAATVTQHERTATQQAAMVSETTTTMEELGASSRKTAEQAEAAAGVAQKSTTLTQEGSESVKSTLEEMSALKGKIEAIAQQILRLSEQTIQVGGIAELVKDLSTQINMLSLNAAVEAARAGEHGKGFAVVAGEVRKLAAESKKSSEQAKTLLAEIQKATNATIMVTEEGTKQVEGVAALAHKVGALFLSLSETADQVFNTAQQVLLNARQQTAAVGQVTEASNAINAGAKETAAGISQTKVGIMKLNEAAQSLKSMI